MIRQWGSRGEGNLEHMAFYQLIKSGTLTSNDTLVTYGDDRLLRSNNPLHVAVFTSFPGTIFNARTMSVMTKEDIKSAAEFASRDLYNITDKNNRVQQR